MTTERNARNQVLLPHGHPSQHGVHLGRCLLLLTRKHVGVDVEGDGCGGVTQPLGHDPDRYTGLEQMGSVRMAKIVKVRVPSPLWWWSRERSREYDRV